MYSSNLTNFFNGYCFYSFIIKFLTFYSIINNVKSILAKGLIIHDQNDEDVKVLSARSFSLYADSSLTIPLGGRANLATSTLSVIPLNQTSITYANFPPQWTAVNWPVTLINSSVTLSWTNSGSAITWKNTL
jgi:hypothetical protein